MRRKLLSALLAVLPLTAQEKPIDTLLSSITIHVSKAGLLSAVAHEHWVNAPIASGAVDEGTPKIEFRVDAGNLTVKPDPKVDEKTRGQIQKDMDEMTLEPEKYTEIAFHSTAVETTGKGQYKVEGTLMLHGASRSITVNVRREGEAYKGQVVIKQTDFGIKPISLAGGTIRIRDTLNIEFQIFTRAAR